MLEPYSASCYIASPYQGDSMRLGLIGLALLLSSPSQAGLRDLLRKGCQAIGVAADYSPYLPGLEITTRTRSTTQYPVEMGREPQVIETIMVHKHGPEVMWQGRKCRTSRIAHSRVGEPLTPEVTTYYYLENGNVYQWTQIDGKDLFVHTNEDPPAKDGLKWKTVTRLPDGKPAWPSENNPDGGVGYEWKKVGAFTIPQTGQRFPDCYKQIAQFRDRTGTMDRIYCAGVGIVYQSSVSEHQFPNHEKPTISRMENWVTNIKYP